MSNCACFPPAPKPTADAILRIRTRAFPPFWWPYAFFGPSNGAPDPWRSFGRSASVKNGNSSWHTGNFHADVHFEFEARMRNDEWPALAEAEGRSAPSAHERLEAAAEGRRSLRAKAGLSEEAGLSDGG